MPCLERGPENLLSHKKLNSADNPNELESKSFSLADPHTWGEPHGAEDQIASCRMLKAVRQ